MDDWAEYFDVAWPWIGLFMALVWLGVLYPGNGLRSRCDIPRRHDPHWLVWLAVPVYMLHQFEEYAMHYDYARRMSFFADNICRHLGYPAYPECPLPVAHFWLINIVLAWILIPFAAYVGKRSFVVALVPWGVIFVNGLMHLFIGIKSASSWLAGENAGIVTSLLLFLPLSLWTAFIFWKQRIVSLPMLGIVMAAGVFAHLLLLAAFAAFPVGGAPLMFGLDFAALLLPLPAAWLAERYARSSKNQAEMD